MTLDDLERQNKDFYGFLAISSCETFQQRIAAKLIEIDIKKAAYEIFSIERLFQWSKSRFSRFKETCARGHQAAVLP